MAYAPGVDVGTLKLIPEANRASTAIVNNYTTVGAGWIDVDCSGVTPVGTKAVLASVLLIMTGDTITDKITVYVRQNGTTASAWPQLCTVDVEYTNLGSGFQIRTERTIPILVDASRIFEHSQLVRTGGGAATGNLYIRILGYYL